MGHGAQAPEPLAEREQPGQRLQLAGDRRMLSECQLSGGAVLQPHDPQLLQADPLGHGGRSITEVEERRPTP